MNDAIFTFTDAEGDQIRVRSIGDDLFFHNRHIEQHPDAGPSVRLSLEQVAALHGALGLWMWQGEDPENVEPVASDGLLERLAAVETRQHAILASLEQDAGKIRRLSVVVSRHDARLRSQGEPEESESVTNSAGEKLLEEIRDRIGSAHDIDRQHYTAQLNDLRRLMEAQHRDLFRQQSALGTSQAQRYTTAHDMIRGLLTEIRDRLPAPPPIECLAPAPHGGKTCLLNAGHIGRHVNAESSWPTLCAIRNRDNFSRECKSPRNHPGPHEDGNLSWPQD